MRTLLTTLNILSFVLILCVCDAFAQVSRLQSTADRKRSASGTAEAPEKVLRISKITGIGNRANVETPIYNTSVPRGASVGKVWTQIEVVYETARSDDEWLSDLTFSYYALAKRTDKEKGVLYTMYRKNIHYVDIEMSRKPLTHRSSVFLRPSAIKRNGELVAVAVEISYNGQIVDKATEYSPGIQLPKSENDEWWKNTVITESKITTVDNDSLLDRAHSPWALINIDDYEVIK